MDYVADVNVNAVNLMVDALTVFMYHSTVDPPMKSTAWPIFATLVVANVNDTTFPYGVAVLLILISVLPLDTFMAFVLCVNKISRFMPNFGVGSVFTCVVEITVNPSAIDAKIAVLFAIF